MADLGAIGYAGPDAVYLLGPSISGVVTDDTAAPAARRVVALRRDTMAIAWSTYSRASDGAYVAPLPLGSAGVEHTVIVQDDDSGSLYNDIVMRVLP